MYYVVRRQNRTLSGATLTPIAISAVVMTLVEGCVWLLAGYTAGDAGLRDVGVASRYLVPNMDDLGKENTISLKNYYIRK